MSMDISTDKDTYKIADNGNDTNDTNDINVKLSIDTNDTNDKNVKLSIWNNIVAQLCAPIDGSSLAIWRIFFGIVMMFDFIMERLYNQYLLTNDKCHFSYFSWITPLNWDGFVLFRAVLTFAHIGIILGFFYKFSCFICAIGAWYLFLLDKTHWNNHSYLFATLKTVMIFLECHACWSFDCVLFSSILWDKGFHVPAWNVMLLRIINFILYFIAGLKKASSNDWVNGKSLKWIAHNFNLTFEEDFRKLFINTGGLGFDLLVASMVCFFFHSVNVNLFEIGVFPHVCIGLISIWWNPSWPRFVLSRTSNILHYICNVYLLPATLNVKESREKIDRKRIHCWHHFTVICLLVLVTFECFLPYSHFITKGYNNVWGRGLYGYSYTMMIDWNTQQYTSVEIVPAGGIRDYYEKLGWHKKKRNRWKFSPDMIFTFSQCIKREYASEYGEGFSLYFDFWGSLNDNQNQRIVNPDFDFGATNLTWSPWRFNEWLMPELFKYDDNRNFFERVNENAKTEDLDATFVADLPGKVLRNYLNGTEVSQVFIQLISGAIDIRLEHYNEPITLQIGQNYTLPLDEDHWVYTKGNISSIYAYFHSELSNEVAVNSISLAGTCDNRRMRRRHRILDVPPLRSNNMTYISSGKFALIGIIDNSTPESKRISDIVHKKINRVALLLNFERFVKLSIRRNVFVCYIDISKQSNNVVYKESKFNTTTLGNVVTAEDMLRYHMLSNIPGNSSFSEKSCKQKQMTSTQIGNTTSHINDFTACNAIYSSDENSRQGIVKSYNLLDKADSKLVQTMFSSSIYVQSENVRKHLKSVNRIQRKLSGFSEKYHQRVYKKNRDRLLEIRLKEISEETNVSPIDVKFGIDIHNMNEEGIKSFASSLSDIQRDEIVRNAIMEDATNLRFTPQILHKAYYLEDFEDFKGFEPFPQNHTAEEIVDFTRDLVIRSKMKQEMQCNETKLLDFFLEIIYQGMNDLEYYLDKYQSFLTRCKQRWPLHRVKMLYAYYTYNIYKKIHNKLLHDYKIIVTAEKINMICKFYIRNVYNTINVKLRYTYKYVNIQWKHYISSMLSNE
eukprot:GSMAST32.ASY1.ANO1.2098.1 assembled CDS